MDSVDPALLSAEPSAVQGLTPEQKERLTEILDRYLSALESGAPLAREELLRAHPDLAGPLETYLAGLDELHEAAAGVACSFRRPEAEPAPAAGDERRLGDFRLGAEIGRGGMGVVYEAEQISLSRRVALKILPFAAVLDSRQIARFKHEAQAAAQLEHPNIVAVYAIGVERGVHYYAMQLIEGQPLDRALGELRDAASAGTGDLCPPTCGSLLTAKSANRRDYYRTVARLGIQAAEALHAAHEHGVVHRDVKPSNLLLDADGKLWVTDFGLARCQSDATLTRTGDVMGTMRYMSPEQALGQSALVDHRTDVYSLGATLYELLAFQPAFPGDNGAALLRRIEQQDPPPPRQLQPSVPADLETVVLKAMSKRREDRYHTAQDLADDLRRVLEGKPTLAKPPTLPDRVAKWARRHKRLVGAAAAFGLLALLGLGAATVLVGREKNRAEQNYARAELHFREAQEAVDLFGARLAERLAGVPGADEVRRELLQETLAYYRRFVVQAKDNPVLKADLALTGSKIGTLTAEIGATADAIAAHDEATRLFRELAAEHPGDPDYRRRLAVSLNNLALVLGRAGRTDAARRAYEEAIAIQRGLLDRGRPTEQALADLALSQNNLGLLQSQTSQLPQAAQSLQEAIRLQEDLLRRQPDSPEALRALAGTLNNLSALCAGTEPARAVELCRKALGYQTRAGALRPADIKYKSDLASTWNNLASMQSRAGQLDEAAASYARAVDLQSELVRAAPAQQSFRHDLAVTYNNLGLTESKLRQPTRAEKSYRQALALQETLVRGNPGDLDLASSLGGIYNNLGIVLEELQRVGEAAECYAQAIEAQRVACSRAPEVSRYRMFLSKHYYNYGRVLRRLGRPDEAAEAALARRTLWPQDPKHLFAVAQELAESTRLLAGAGRPGMNAADCAVAALDTLRQAKAAGWKPGEGQAWTESFAALKGYPGFESVVRN